MFVTFLKLRKFTNLGFLDFRRLRAFLIINEWNDQLDKMDPSKWQTRDALKGTKTMHI